MSKLMKKKGLRTFLIVVLVIIAFVLFFKLKGSSVSDNSDKYAGVDFDTMSSEYQREGQYSDYVAKRRMPIHQVVPMIFRLPVS